MKSTKQNGFTLFEVLAALACSSLIMLLICNFLLLEKKLIQNNADRLDLVLKELRLWGIIALSERLANQRFGLQGVVIHPLGLMQDALGNEITPSNTKNMRVKPGSNPISFLHLESELAFTVLTADHTGNFLRLRLCIAQAPSKEQILTFKAVSPWLLLSHEQQTEFLGSLKANTHACSVGSGFELVGTARIQGVFTKRHSELEDKAVSELALAGQIHRAFPVRDAFTLYVANENSLRRLAHFKQENQPVEGDVIFLRAHAEDITLGFLHARDTEHTLAIPRSHESAFLLAHDAIS